MTTKTEALPLAQPQDFNNEGYGRLPDMYAQVVDTTDLPEALCIPLEKMNGHVRVVQTARNDLGRLDRSAFNAAIETDRETDRQIILTGNVVTHPANTAAELLVHRRTLPRIITMHTELAHVALSEASNLLAYELQDLSAAVAPEPPTSTAPFKAAIAVLGKVREHFAKLDYADALVAWMVEASESGRKVVATRKPDPEAIGPRCSAVDQVLRDLEQHTA